MYDNICLGDVVHCAMVALSQFSNVCIVLLSDSFFYSHKLQFELKMPEVAMICPLWS